MELTYSQVQRKSKAVAYSLSVSVPRYGIGYEKRCREDAPQCRFAHQTSAMSAALYTNPGLHDSACHLKPMA